MNEAKKEYFRRYMAERRANARGFDTRKAAQVALRLMGLGLTAAQVRDGLYLAAADGAFGVLQR